MHPFIKQVNHIQREQRKEVGTNDVVEHVIGDMRKEDDG
jgi:hypothetical protein